jgi:hypothetical protein
MANLRSAVVSRSRTICEFSANALVSRSRTICVKKVHAVNQNAQNLTALGITAIFASFNFARHKMYTKLKCVMLALKW